MQSVLCLLVLFTNGPVEFATIVIYKQGTTQAISGTTTDVKDNFARTGIPIGEHQISINFSGYQQTTKEHLQGSNTGAGTYNFAVRKQFITPKASIRLMTNVPFSNYINQCPTIISPRTYQFFQYQVPFHSLGISLSYKFGKLTFKKDKNKGTNNSGGLSSD